jgi:cytochrome b pre-mRNA-processing protein 3
MVFNWLRKRDETADACYAAAVDLARDPWFYTVGAVPDTVDGRFDMVALMLSAVIARLELSGPETAGLRQKLRELFVDDMDRNVREMGVGDLSVGKHVKRMMQALDGRLNAYRPALTGDASDQLFAALERNLYRGEPPSSHGPDLVAERLLKLFNALKALPDTDIAAGKLGEAA